MLEHVKAVGMWCGVAGRALRDQAKEKAKEILLEWQKELEDTKAEAKRLQQLLLRLKVNHFVNHFYHCHPPPLLLPTSLTLCLRLDSVCVCDCRGRC